MNMVIASIVFVLLFTISLAYFLWSIGSRWPVRDHELLARTVVGRPNVTRISRVKAFIYAIFALAAGIVALSIADHTAGELPLTIAGVLVGLFFIARGIAGYTQRWRSYFPVEPFATLDRKNYSPLFLAIGIGFAVLVVMRLI
jgi:hypothetical protein